MKIQFQKDAFEPAFQFVRQAVAKRDVRPVYQNVLIVADPNGAALTASNGRFSARAVVPSGDGFAVEEPGAAIIPTKAFEQILSETVESQVVATANDTQLKVVCGTAVFRLSTSPASEAPNVQPFDDASRRRLSSATFATALRRTAFAVDLENSHYALGGVWLEFDDETKTYNAVATDGRRLAEDSGNFEIDGRPGMSTVVLDAGSIPLITSATRGAEETLVALGDGVVRVKSGDREVCAAVVEGRFPNWRRIVPDKTVRRRVEFPAGVLATATRQAGIVASAKAPTVRFTIGGGNVVIDSRGAEIGESRVSFPVTYDGPNASVSFGSTFVNDFLKRVEPEELVVLWFLDDKPALFETSDGYTYVLMPLVSSQIGKDEK